MTEFMDIFYNCVSKILTADILEKDGEYLSRKRYMDEEIKRLYASLGEKTAQRVDDLLTEQIAIGELRECACFRAGFRTALELTR